MDYSKFLNGSNFTRSEIRDAVVHAFDNPDVSQSFYEGLLEVYRAFCLGKPIFTIQIRIKNKLQ